MKLSAPALYHISIWVLGAMLGCSRDVSGAGMPVMAYTDARCIKALAPNASGLDDRQGESRIPTALGQRGSAGEAQEGWRLLTTQTNTKDT